MTEKLQEAPAASDEPQAVKPGGEKLNDPARETLSVGSPETTDAPNPLPAGSYAEVLLLVTWYINVIEFPSVTVRSVVTTLTVMGVGTAHAGDPCNAVSKAPAATASPNVLP